MIKYRQIILLELERYPRKCRECPMFTMMPYQCHNERGTEGGCRLGYMDGNDMRDFYGDMLFTKCDIKNNPNVTIKRGICDSTALDEQHRKEAEELKKEDPPRKRIRFEDDGKVFTINGKRFDMREFLGKDDE